MIGLPIRAMTLAELKSRFERSRLPVQPPRVGELRVGLTMPSWTIYRSTDRSTIYDRFTQLGQRFPLRFFEPRNRSFLLRSNADYIVRRIAAKARVALPDPCLTPPVDYASELDVIYSSGLYPSTDLHTPVLWEQTFAPQLNVDGPAWIRCLRKAWTIAAERATRVVTPTPVSAEWFADIFPAQRDKIDVVPFFLPDVTAICAASMEAKLQSTGPVRVIFVGKEARRKGLDVLARAFASLPSAIQSQLRVQVVSRMLDGPVELPVGWEHIAYAPDVHALMRQADVLAFPTKVEAYGLVLVEGLAAGCAVLTTKAPLQRSIVGDDAGYFVDPNDHATVALALSHVVEDRAKLASRIRAARARFESRYEATIVGRDYHRLLWATSGKTPPP